MICRRSDAIDTLTTYWSAIGNDDAIRFRADAFAHETNPDHGRPMRPFAGPCGIRHEGAIADCDAFITNERRRARDELSDSVLRTVTERATILPSLEQRQQ